MSKFHTFTIFRTDLSPEFLNFLVSDGLTNVSQTEKQNLFLQRWHWIRTKFTAFRKHCLLIG